MPKSKSQTHLTPDRVWQLIEQRWGLKKEQFHDPVPAYTPYKAPIFFNGLYGSWKDYNYVNCPFEKETLEKFVAKADEQANHGKISVMLLPTKTDQDWYHDIILKNNYEKLWIRRRLHFKNDKNHATDTHFLALIK